jgi:hypothetical protein
MNPLWNLFGKGGSKVGEADGQTKEDIERVAREELGLDVTADAKRAKVEAPCKHGWWDDCGKDKDQR